MTPAKVEALEKAWGALLSAVVDVLECSDSVPEHESVRFDAPVGTEAERNGKKVWPGAWLRFYLNGEGDVQFDVVNAVE